PPSPRGAPPRTAREDAGGGRAADRAGGRSTAADAGGRQAARIRRRVSRGRVVPQAPAAAGSSARSAGDEPAPGPDDPPGSSATWGTPRRGWGTTSTGQP